MLLEFQGALAFPRAPRPCGSIPTTQMGEQIERVPAIQLRVRALGVHDVTRQKTHFGLEAGSCPLRQSLLPGK